MTSDAKESAPNDLAKATRKRENMQANVTDITANGSNDEFEVSVEKNINKVSENLPHENGQSHRKFIMSAYDEELYIRRLLARRSFHLPRNNWCEDWMQFIKNNHVLFGLCCHHPLHPLKLGHRVFILIGSIAFGLTATNSVYLWYAYSDEDMNKILVQVSLGEVPIGINLEELQITHGMVTLWTFGSILHSFFDVSLWFMTACLCFLEGNICGRYHKYRSIGSYVVVAIVAVMVALSSFAIAGRVIYETRLNAARNGNALDDEQWMTFLHFESYSFLLGFGVESLLTYLVYYPLIVTIGFTGMLRPFFQIFPCARFLGGRSAELARQFEERKLMSRQRQKRGGKGDEFVADDASEDNML